MTTNPKQERYRHFFNIYLDHNGDGHIDKDDIDILINKLSKAREWKPDQSEYKAAKQTWYEILDCLLEDLDQNKDGRVSIEEWTAVYDNYSKNPSQSPRWQTLFEEFCFKSGSTDGYTVKKENFVRNMTMFGFSSENIAAAFDKSAKGKPYLTKDEFTKLWREYFTSDDSDTASNCMFMYKRE